MQQVVEQHLQGTGVVVVGSGPRAVKILLGSWIIEVEPHSPTFSLILQKNYIEFFTSRKTSLGE
jgi:hypothetical protein